ncbi:MAG TPA: CBS domain-containing protein [Rhodopila sp.]
MSHRTVSEIIRRQDPATLPVTATVQTACRVMRDRRVGAVIVTEADGRLAGLFTGRDAVGRVLAEALDPATTPLGAVMTVEPDTLRPQAQAEDALRMMRNGGYRHLPIVEGSKIAGIVSRGDFTCPDRARVDETTGFQDLL